ncbi:MAG: hypothetical protein ACON5G_07470 [Pirellulaceae bacterium]|nr:hypothetical protein [Pirellulales bacterium]
MNLIQQLIIPAFQRFREASFRVRATAAICLLLIIVSFSAMALRSPSIEMVPLHENHEFTNTEITQVTQHFVAAGLNHWELKSKQIFIPKQQRIEYLTALDGKFEPHTLNSDVDSVLNNGSILDTQSLREMRLRNAREKDLARIIMQIPGVEEAQINIDDHQQRGLSGKTEMTALAAIKASQNNEVTLEMSEAIREVTAARFAGLDRNHVVVVDLNTGHTFGATNSNYSTSSLDMALRNYERWWRGRISNLLIDIPNVRIEVGLYPVAKSESDTASQAVKASVSVGIPDSYIQQVANNRRATSIQQQQATANEVKQNVIELVQGVIPVVPHTTIEEFDVHVARILDLTADQTNNSATHWTAQLQSLWREIIMSTLVLSFIATLVWKNNKPSATESRDKQALQPLRETQTDSLPPLHDIQDEVQFSHGPHLEKPPVIPETETLLEPTLKDELNALVDQAPADAADILKKWISSTSQ